MPIETKFCNQDAINEAAEKLDTPKYLIKQIEEHWQRLAVKTVTSGEFKNIRIPYLIKIEFNKKKMDAINYTKARMEKKNKELG